MTQAPYCDDVDALIDVARTAASAFGSPLPDAEVVKAAQSAWKHEADGTNWIGRRRQRPLPSEPIGLIDVSEDAFVLLSKLRHYNGGRSEFWVANEMAKTITKRGWDRERFAAAREVLLDHGHITLIRAAHTGSPASYAWGRS